MRHITTLGSAYSPVLLSLVGAVSSTDHQEIDRAIIGEAASSV